VEYDISVERIDSLEPWPVNPNEGDVGAISQSVTRNGWYGVVVAQKSSRRILAGHHRIEAAQQLGQSDVPVFWHDVDDATAERIVLGDNRTNRLGRDDGAALLDMLQKVASEPLVGLDGTGWDGDDLDELLARLNGLCAGGSGAARWASRAGKTTNAAVVNVAATTPTAASAACPPARGAR